MARTLLSPVTPHRTLLNPITDYHTTHTDQEEMALTDILNTQRERERCFYKNIDLELNKLGFFVKDIYSILPSTT